MTPQRKDGETASCKAACMVMLAAAAEDRGAGGFGAQKDQSTAAARARVNISTSVTTEHATWYSTPQQSVPDLVLGAQGLSTRPEADTRRSLSTHTDEREPREGLCISARQAASKQREGRDPSLAHGTSA